MGLVASLSWLALALTPGLASRLSGRLPEEFGGAGGGVSGAVAAVGAVPVVAQAEQEQAFKRAEKELASIRGTENWRLVSRSDPEYPRTLLQIYDPPVLPTCAGRAGVERAQHQHRGDEASDAVWDADGGAAGPADCGAGCGSGQQDGVGIDALAHQGAMVVYARAIGVLGTGVNMCYPKENKMLYEGVLERGASISGFAEFVGEEDLRIVKFR